ncbi:hypothetical protein ACLOJK_036950 [Asimina triloba]
MPLPLAIARIHRLCLFPPATADAHLHRLPTTRSLPTSAAAAFRHLHLRLLSPDSVDRPHRCLIKVSNVGNSVAHPQQTTPTADIVCIDHVVVATVPIACYSARILPYKYRCIQRDRGIRFLTGSLYTENRIPLVYNRNAVHKGQECSACPARLHGNHVVIVLDRRRRKGDAIARDGPPHDAAVGFTPAASFGLLLHEALLCLCLCL